MSDLKTCFVIIGFGKKTSYANGKLRVLDLDQTFSLLIKPVFDALGIQCYRAIDKNLSGSIDKLMLKEIKEADIALADISTLNANVMWELGVRHALKPRHTIMICEIEQMSTIPFDIGHFIVHSYTHTEYGIPFNEVDRFKTHLTRIINGIKNQDPTVDDSPVFTFLKDELTSKTNGGAAPGDDPALQKDESFAGLLAKAEAAKNKKDFENALVLFGVAKTLARNNMLLRDNLGFIISRLALCTYKSGRPDEVKPLEDAKTILQELNPQQSNDIEVLGLSGAIDKRLYELTDDERCLENAIGFYEKGFQLKQDYYNGINAAFMLYKKAALLKTQQQEWEDIKLNADYTRNAVLNICLQLEKEEKFSDRQDAIWILLTIAEAYNYRGNKEKLKEYEDKANEIALAKNDSFAMSSYQDQKNKIESILTTLQSSQ